MVKNNPYIPLVKEDIDIISHPEDIYIHRGKWATYFNNTNPLILEIGTGMGNFFSKQVGSFPQKNFIGMEIRYKRCFQTAEKSRKSIDSFGEIKQKRKNSFVILKDFAQNVGKIFISGEVSETYIFFPDPWAQKKKQLKHRLFQKDFLEILYKITTTGGKVFFKTDHREYFDSTLELITSQGLWKIENWTHNYNEEEIFDMGNITEFEAFYRGENIEINYLELTKD